jgi:hypothetical protein
MMTLVFKTDKEGAGRKVPKTEKSKKPTKAGLAVLGHKG